MLKTIKSIEIKILLVLSCSAISLQSQPINDRYNNYGEIIISELSTTPFPHQKRINGYTYGDKEYPFEKHYNDSTVLIFIPKDFQSKEENDFVIHFHGWYNNVDSVLSQFKLIEQFSESKKNAILVVPQGPKNAPDSFGGKLEDENGLRNLITEISDLLYKKKIVNSMTVGKIILSGHSGGYHVISYILLRGDLTKNIREVFLFDGLYGQIEKFTYWINHYDGKFINIYTKDGGTKYESENLMECFDAWQVPYLFKNEIDLSDSDLKNNRIVFIYTNLQHNEVISVRSEFMRFLKASCLEDI
jgi:hypothetical protein